MLTRARLFGASQVLLLVAALALTVATSRASDWQPWELVPLLAALAVASDFVTIPVKHLRISGTHVIFVLAMALLGPGPAVAIALTSAIVDGIRTRPPRLLFLNNLATNATFGVLGGLSIRWVSEGANLTPTSTGFLLLVFVV